MARLHRVRTQIVVILAGVAVLVAGSTFASVDPLWLGATDSVGAALSSMYAITTPGCMLLLSAVLPTDRRLIRALCVVGVLVYVWLTIAWAQHVARKLESTGCESLPAGCVASLGCRIGNTCAAAVGAATLVPTVCPGRGCRFAMSPRQALSHLWRSVLGVAFFFGVFFLAWAIANAAITDGYSSSDSFVTHLVQGCVCLLSCVCFQWRVRRLVNGWVGAVADVRSRARTASLVAALIGGAQPKRVLSGAESSFKVLPFDCMNEDMFSSSASTAEERSQEGVSRKAKLGDCDFFLSHSWSDSYQNKWAALRKHAAVFRQQTGRDPTIWLDKMCIDQDNIDAGLAMLPVYLAGCEKLLVVAGHSYTSRLWCVMELFVFFAMGGTADKLQVVTISDDSEIQASSCDSTQSLLQLDVGDAHCFKREDEEHLLAVIEAAFGSFTKFNQTARTMLHQALASQEGCVWDVSEA